MPRLLCLAPPLSFLGDNLIASWFCSKCVHTRCDQNDYDQNYLSRISFSGRALWCPLMLNWPILHCFLSFRSVFFLEEAYFHLLILTYFYSMISISFIHSLFSVIILTSLLLHLQIQRISFLTCFICELLSHFFAFINFSTSCSLSITLYYL